MLAFKNGRIVTPFKEIPKGTILVEGQKIVAFGPNDIIKIPPLAKIFDISNKIICPGFIDIHVHGAGGKDFSDASPESIKKIISFHINHGTALFLPTILSLPTPLLAKTLDQLPKAWAKTDFLSSFLGIHLEGPFLNPSQRGVHKLQHLCKPSIETMQAFLEHSANTIKMVTLAPELPHCAELIQWLSNQNIVASLGHSDASYLQTKKAFRKGLHHITHIFNTMKGLHHREPGALGATLNNNRISTDIIVDGYHVHPAAVQLLWRQKGVENIILITDASPVCGLSKGNYTFWNTQIQFDGKKALTRESKNLAGSVVTLDRAVKNFKRITKCSIAEAIQLITFNPAALLNLQNRKGQIRRGHDADLVIMDEDFSISMVVINGTIMHTQDK